MNSIQKKNFVIIGGIGKGKTRYVERLIKKRKKRWAIIKYDGADYKDVDSSKTGKLMIVIDEALFFLKSKHDFKSLLNLDYTELYLCTSHLDKFRRMLREINFEFQIIKVSFRGYLSWKVKL